METHMDWKRLLNSNRLANPHYRAQQNRPIFLQDFDRIAFSAPFRRLANKTQVHPLYENDHLHHRLIHSMETANVGRTLGAEVGDWLEREKELPAGTREAISNAVQAACLAHDIGNPPFGHSGETAIGEWFRTSFAEERPPPLLAQLPAAYRGEFEHFEGNAQGFRILTRLEMYRNDGGMRLGLAVLGAFMKYPVTEQVWSSVKSKTSYVGLKKFGVFSTEADILAEVCDELGIPSTATALGSYYVRHPLVFLVEAADDICYGVLDTEDGFAAGDLRFAEAEEALAALADHADPAGSTQCQADRLARLAYLRALAVRDAVQACVRAFREHYDEIMNGTFSNSLTKVCDKARAFDDLRKLANDAIYKAQRKSELEITGRNALHRILSGLMPVFTALRDAGWNQEGLRDYSYEGDLVRALALDLRDVNDERAALHALTDFVSGMTDRYAAKVARMLSGL